MANKNFAPDRRALLFTVSAFALAGCGGLGLGPDNPDQTIYMLEPAPAPPPSGGAVNWALAIDVPDAIDSLDTRRITLIKANNTLDYYANAQWPDRLPIMVQTALLASFQASGRIPSVARTQDALHADYELGTEIRDFAAHYSAPDGVPSVTVTILAQISTAHGRKIVASTSASATMAASANSTQAAVQAFNGALGATVAQIVAWALALPALPPT